MGAFIQPAEGLNPITTGMYLWYEIQLILPKTILARQTQASPQEISHFAQRLLMISYKFIMQVGLLLEMV